MDVAHLKGKYKGMMFTAVCMDVNSSIFPLAWGLGYAKNDASWLWFFTRFKELYGDRPRIFIVLYWHQSISKAVVQVYPNAFHAICMQHLLHNIKNNVRRLSVDMLYF